MKANRSGNIFLEIVERIIWAVFGALIALTAIAQLALANKVIIIIAMFLILVIVFLLFSMNRGSATNGRKESSQMKPLDMSSNNRIQGNSRVVSQSDRIKSEARISRNSGMQAGNPLDNKPMSSQKREMQKQENKQVKSLVLINEEGDTLLEWSLMGKTALIIGKSTEKEPVDIDLECSAYARMISKQHAVLNYTNGGWYIDDIDSKNGTRVKKLYQNSIMDVKLVGTVEVESGDIIYIASTMLQLR